MISAADALERLQDGNRRYAKGDSHLNSRSGHQAGMAAGQRPFAIVLACSDSRVPVEMVFDQGLGDLFVIRVAGNIVAPSQIGSIEFAATRFGTRLVVVLGHSNCGAVSATLDELSLERTHRSPNLRSIVDRIRPAVEGLDKRSLHDAVIANVKQSVDQLRHGSLLLEQFIESGELAIVGAEYSIETGEVQLLDTP